MITRAALASLHEYLTHIQEEDFSLPSPLALTAMSTLIDQAAQKAFSEADAALKSTDYFAQAKSVIEKTPRTCGGFAPHKALLTHMTPFEQIAVVAHWVEEKGGAMTKPHTLTLAGHDDHVVPLWVKKPKSSSATLMTTVLGSTRGRYKAPAYPDWQERNPLSDIISSAFIDPLNTLEIYRQPSCLGALLIKASSFEEGTLPHSWRYQVHTAEGDLSQVASVELPGQKLAKVRRIKEQSAGYNLAKLMSLDVIRDKNLVPCRLYEDYHEEGYDDEAEPFASPSSLIKSLSPALEGDTSSLDALIELLFATRLGKSSNPSILSFTASKLF